jgi:hypothetical protein
MIGCAERQAVAETAAHSIGKAPSHVLARSGPSPRWSARALDSVRKPADPRATPAGSGVRAARIAGTEC